MVGDPILIGGMPVLPEHLVFGLAAVAGMALLALLIVAGLGLARRGREAAERAAQAKALDAELAELKVRLQTLAEMSVTRQGELARSLNERLDRVTARVGHDLTETSRKTGESLSRLNERLAVIDRAQKNITELSTNVVGLQQILANKQQRGAFGQGRMEAIVQDALPKDSFTFQATLSNRSRPDCLIRMPNAPGFVIDAKFPLEGFEAFRGAADAAARKDAARAVRQDVSRHVEAIASNYLIPGETQDTALMFVPSEAVYVDLHEHFPDLLQKAARARIVIVSPNMLLLAVQTMQAVLRDVRMREQAGLIQKEVSHLLADVHRLRERVLKLQQHFGMAGKDLEMILTSSDKISGRGRRIDALDFDDADEPDAGEDRARAARPARPPRLLAGE